MSAMENSVRFYLKMRNNVLFLESNEGKCMQPKLVNLNKDIHR